jgi:hypothetical protein
VWHGVLLHAAVVLLLPADVLLLVVLRLAAFVSVLPLIGNDSRARRKSPCPRAFLGYL